MTDDTPSLRDRQFSSSMRGYDRDEVDEFKAKALARIADLEAQLAQGESHPPDVGVTDPAGLQVELGAIGAEVDSILEAARAFAKGLRDRATADAARWRAEADQESRSLRSQAEVDAEQMRGQAWDAAAEMIAAAQAETEALAESASEDALFIRAEAEREALRLTSEARREADETARSGRVEAERFLMAARAESEDILESARQSAESAQERARALEQRRAELLEELEAARNSIGQLEQEIDTRREALQIASTGAVTHPGGTGDHTWLEDDGSVRIISAAQMRGVEPVDADAMAAEVERLRTAEEPTIVEPEGMAPRLKEVAAPEPQIGPSEETVRIDASDEHDDEAATGETAPETGLHVEAAPEAPEPPEQLAQPEEPEQPAEAPDELENLFASLRAPGAEAPHDAVGVTTPNAEPAQDGTERRDDAGRTAVAVARQSAVDPFELRDRLLLPIANRALRAVKRDIVDLQNRVLEEVRVGEPGWLPDRPLVAASFGPEIRQLERESYLAGHSAAAEMVGSQKTPQPGSEGPGIATAGFVDALHEAVRSALASSDGARQVSAAASKVFRAWRTDDAERRLRLAAIRAYHEGLLMALADLGVAAVTAVCPGAVCRDGCPAETGATWDPSGPLPDGILLPPAAPSCQSAIVPI